MNELIKATEIRLFKRFWRIFSHFEIESAKTEGDWPFKTYEI